MIENLLQSFLSILYFYIKEYDLQVKLDSCACKIVNKQLKDILMNILQMLYYDRVDISEGIDLTKNSSSKECMICH